ncbi:hypothetical protein KIW84_042108 [Lathyrus oleraceus]|uniref:Uncharacterized protein n=1 Tax=Pisum sativum TaxID=3888 RepID=A0A9D4XC03_PEA|nr:hypothetical protein KIW84_042108 [Pisum sativum]
MLTARLQAEEAQARAQVHNSGQTSAQNQPQIQNQTTAAPVTTVIVSEINDVPVTSVTITASRPWEIPRDLNQDRYQQEFVPPNAPVFTNVPPVVHYTPHLGEPVYHGPTPRKFIQSLLFSTRLWVLLLVTRLVDAANGIDVLIPDLPLTWNSNDIFELTNCDVIMDGIDGLVDQWEFSESLSCRMIFSCLQVSHKFPPQEKAS